MFWCLYVHQKCSFNLQNADILVCSDHKALLKIFTGYTNNEKSNTWGLEATAIPRCVNIQHIKSIAYVLGESVSRLTAVGLYHDGQHEFISSFEPSPPVEQVTRMLIDIFEIFIAPDIEKLTNYCDALHDLPTVQMAKASLSLGNASAADIPHLEQNLTSLPEFTQDKVIILQKEWYILQKHIRTYTLQPKQQLFHRCHRHPTYKKVINFNSTFSAAVIPQILIKYLLHTSNDSLGHTGAMKLYHFIKRLYYFQGMRKKIYQYARSHVTSAKLWISKNHILLTYIRTLHKHHKITFPLIC